MQACSLRLLHARQTVVSLSSIFSKSEEVGFPFGPVRAQARSLRIHTARQTIVSLSSSKIGRGRIRTHGRLRDNCFQDSRNRPLCHFSTLKGDLLYHPFKKSQARRF